MPATALYERHGEAFHPTDLTRGGWSDDAQHGGPPCGLLAWAVEHHDPDPPMTTVRYTFDLLRPVPLTPLTVSVVPVRPGRRVQVLRASLRAGEVEVATVSALRVRRADVDFEDPPPPPWHAPPGPEQGQGVQLDDWGIGDLRRFHRDAVTINSLDGSFEERGPGTAWFRLDYPLIAGEATSARLQLATLADIANGLTRQLDHFTHLYVNPDVTLYLHRVPASEWIGMRGTSYPSHEGHGMTDTVVFDEHGHIGRIVQAQLLGRHSGISAGE